MGVFLSYPLIGPEAWHRAFLAGLAESCARLAAPLLGGDTVAPRLGPRTLSLTALGEAGPCVPSRAGAGAGEGIWVTGTLGDAGAGLRALRGALPHDDHLVARYRRPEPRLAEGRKLAAHASAMMDVSDGLLIDLSRMAAASGVAATVHLDRLPLSEAFTRILGTARAARLAAATAGDDYELLFALDGEPPVPATRIGAFATGAGLTLLHDGQPVPLPASLGWEHELT